MRVIDPPLNIPSIVYMASHKQAHNKIMATKELPYGKILYFGIWQNFSQC